MSVRAAVMREFEQPLEIREYPDPVAGPGEAVVRVAMAGICGTDRSPSSVPGAFTAANRPGELSQAPAAGRSLATFGTAPSAASSVAPASPKARGARSGFGAPQRPSHLILLKIVVRHLQIQRFTARVKLTC